MSKCVRNCASAITVFLLASAPAIAQHKPRPTLEQRVSVLEAIVGAQAEQIDQLQDRIHRLRDRLLATERVIEDHRAKLACMSMTGNDVFFTGCNVNIVNGLASTETTNGVGNLIVGYNEPTSVDDHLPNSPSIRTGSHNLVMGTLNSYTSYSGVVTGRKNAIRAPNANVTGSIDSTAAAEFAIVSGGIRNNASGVRSIIVGGNANAAGGQGEGTAIVIGGGDNTARLGIVIGGSFNQSDGGAIIGGHANQVSGGQVNGGTRNRASGGGTITGGEANQATGNGSSVSGGFGNQASGDFSTVSGGRQRTATGEFDWAAGGLFEDQ
jgi:hypothetical protein